MRIAGSFLLLCWPSCTIADITDLGVYGTTFPVRERNIITVLTEKMTSDKGKEVLNALEKKLNDMAERSHYVPKSADHVTATPVHNSYLFDPSLSLSHDLSDHQGTRFYTAGEPLNPFDHITLSKEYVFIDGNRPKQIEWVKTLKKEKRMMIILVKGDPMTLMKTHGLNVFFDQEGAMTTRFQLSHVPCVMAQEGKMLRITEWTEEEISS